RPGPRRRGPAGLHGLGAQVRAPGPAGADPSRGLGGGGAPAGAARRPAVGPVVGLPAPREPVGRWPVMTIEVGKIRNVGVVGYGDFIADARAGLRVVEAAVVVVDAVAGVQVQTEKVWKFANDENLPRVVVVNRLDRERADFYRTLESLARRLKGRLVALQIPV